MNYLFTTTLLVLAALIVSPRARAVLFPPAPLALVHTLSGAPMKPSAGILSTTDSLTGAPENLKGETVENEANNFIRAMVSIGADVILGRDIQEEAADDDLRLSSRMIPAPCEIATVLNTAKDKADGADGPAKQASLGPIESAFWIQTQPLMHAMSTMSDVWERFTQSVMMSPKRGSLIDASILIRRDFPVCLHPKHPINLTNNAVDSL